MSKIVKKFKYGSHQVTIETGEIARQATGAVVVDMDGTTVLVTVVGKKTADKTRSFFPLTVNYQEKTYSAGKIPGSYFKREGRPSEFETLTARLIDRPIRPLFPNGYRNEVQVVVTVMSFNPEVSTEIPSMIGASAALSLSGIPFAGPIGAARVGYRDGEFLLNPSAESIKTSELDLIVAGTETGVLMVESQANLLPEQTMLDAVWYGHEQMQVIITAINELVEEGGKDAWEWIPPVKNEALEKQVADLMQEGIANAYQVVDKMARQTALAELREKLVTALCNAEDDSKPASEAVLKIFSALEKSIVRTRVLDGLPRIDGRDTRTVRPISVRTGVLPRTHGSALFTRGETQAIVVATLGTSRDAQRIDCLSGDTRIPFMLHYNFPPYCVGETGMMGSPKRREIGHGVLAKRGVTAVVPTEEEFPYVLRVVSEITESNGSSSMASVCGTSLALMDAGVPIKAPVAGVAMGLVKDGAKFAVLTDILGDEDHLGDMDFKVAGSADGITALQMDLKITAINKFIMEKALEQAKEGRLHILGIMNEALSTPRTELSEHAPQIIVMKIHPDKVRTVIGKGGATIRAITEATGVNIDLEDDGTVKIFAVDAKAGAQAREMVEGTIAEAEVGKIYEGDVIKILDFGAVVKILPNKDGLVHISQMADSRVENVTDIVKEGERVRVKVIEVDRQGRVRLCMKPSIIGEATQEPEPKPEPSNDD
jgi:polyribonucleotide nucleotidyltransferase